MSLRKIGKLVSLLLLYYLLAWYSTRILENIEYENYLIRAWQSSFYKLDVRCIHWITMRIAIWVAVFLELMRLENPLTIYLFIRERNFISLFIKTYCKCLLEVIFYFGLAMLAMAAYFFLLTGSWEVRRPLAGKDSRNCFAGIPGWPEFLLGGIFFVLLYKTCGDQLSGDIDAAPAFGVCCERRTYRCLDGAFCKYPSCGRHIILCLPEFCEEIKRR